MAVCGSQNGSGGAPQKGKEEKEEMFTLANDRKHTKPASLFQDLLSKDVRSFCCLTQRISEDECGHGSCGRMVLAKRVWKAREPGLSSARHAVPGPPTCFQLGCLAQGRES